jgi:hypothetical protein
MQVAVWQEGGGQLFRELKEVIQGFMDALARQCDDRFAALMREPGGPELEGLASGAVPLDDSDEALLPGPRRPAGPQGGLLQPLG